MRRLLLALVLAGCGGSPDMMPADLGAPDSCQPPLTDGGGCDSSTDCTRGSACVSGACATIGACVSGCSSCTLGRLCNGLTCEPPPGMLCGPCGEECTQAGGTCRSSFCATKCDDKSRFCPQGFRCDIPANKTSGVCIPSLATGCAGCAADSDCPMGEVCNVNNRRCVATPTGPDARLEMVALDFLFPDNSGDGGVTYHQSRNISWSLGFFSRRDPSFDPYALAPGTCASERSSFDENAPFPVGPLRDAGDPLTLKIPKKTIDFALIKEDNPVWGYTYSALGLMVADWTPGPASWSSPGGTSVGPFTVAGTIPPEFTTTPDILAPTPIPGDTKNGITLTLDAPAPAGVGTWLEVSYNEAMGNTVTSLTRIACRAPDGATSVTIPGPQLAAAPRSSSLTLLVTRATVADFTAKNLQQGRAAFGMQKVGETLIAP